MCLSKHSPDAVVAHVVHLRLFVCFLVMFSVSIALVTCIDDPHRLKCATKTQVRSQHISLSIHAVATLNKSLTFQCLRILERVDIESTHKRNAAMRAMSEEGKKTADALQHARESRVAGGDMRNRRVACHNMTPHDCHDDLF